MASNKKVEKVLIIVDVANCFIAKGSFAMHQLNKNQLYENYEQIKQISNLIDNNDHIIFTRDFHPQYHASLAYGKNKKNQDANYNVTYPFHCRDLGRVCFNIEKNKNKEGYQDSSTIEHDSIIEYFKKNIENIPSELITKIMLNNIPENNNNKINILKQKIIGPNLTFLYYGTKYYKTIYKLTQNEDYTIGLSNSNNKSHFKEPSLELIDIKTPLIIDNKSFVQLTKGQFCNYESYSAFNYHLGLTNPRNGKETSKIALPANKENSTGLNEYILKNIFKNNTNKNISIDITVCGLVGDICVINTILQGYLMIKKVYKLERKYSFTYSLAGTLFVGGGANGFELKPTIDDHFFEKMKDRIHYLLSNEIALEDLMSFNNFIFCLLDYEEKNIGCFNISVYKHTDINESSLKKNNKINKSYAISVDYFSKNA